MGNGGSAPGRDDEGQREIEHSYMGQRGRAKFVNWAPDAVDQRVLHHLRDEQRALKVTLGVTVRRGHHPSSTRPRSTTSVQPCPPPTTSSLSLSLSFQCDTELAIIWETLGVHLEMGVPYPSRPDQADLADWANNRANMRPYQSKSPLWKDMGFQGQVSQWMVDVGGRWTCARTPALHDFPPADLKT